MKEHSKCNSYELLKNEIKQNFIKVTKFLFIKLFETSK